MQTNRLQGSKPAEALKDMEKHQIIFHVSNNQQPIHEPDVIWHYEVAQKRSIKEEQEKGVATMTGDSPFKF